MKHLLLHILSAAALLAITPAIAQNNKIVNPRQLANGGELLFMENKGQVTDSKGNAAAGILFTAGNGNVKLYITGNTLNYQFTKLEYPAGLDLQKLHALTDAKKKHEAEGQVTRSVQRFQVSLAGANPNPVVRKYGEGSYTENFYSAANPAGITGVHGYEKIVLENVYKGIDWVIYSNNGLMEYDFIVHTGANPSLIKLKIDGADSYGITATGELKMKTKLGEITERTPVSYDEQNNTIKTSFVKNADATIGFSVKAVANQTLRIDPAIAWSTYYGGTGDDYGNAVAVDTSGNVFLAGTTNSTAGIASGGFQKLAGGGFDAFLVKFSPAGKKLWASYYGGPSDDYGTSCTFDGHNNVYLTGYTYSASGIASPGAFKTSFGGIFDGFLVKFASPNGSRAWATYIGAVNEDEPTACATDTLGYVYIVGYTGSTTGFTSGGNQNTFGGGYWDGFLTKYNSAGSRQWATYYGGNGDDFLNTIMVDSAGTMYMGGTTSSTTGISSGGFQNALAGGFYDAFLVKTTAAGVRAWATYYGGTGNDYGTSCTADAAGNVYLAGYTNSAAGIAAGGYQNIIGAGGQNDAFLVKFSKTGTRTWGTYYGDAGTEYGYYCSLDKNGAIYLAGSTTSAAGMASGGFQNKYAGGTDAFAAKFTAGGGRTWASYFGGPGKDAAYACAAAGNDSLYFAGYTASTTGIAHGGFKTNFSGGSYDAFLAKTSGSCAASVTIAVTPGATICDGTKTIFTATPVNGGGAPLYQWKKNNINVGSNTASYTDTIIKNKDSVWVVLTSNAACAAIPTATSANIKMTVTPKAVPSVSIIASPAGAICPGTKVTFTATPVNGGAAPAYQWKKGAANVGTNTATYADSLLKNNDSVWVILTSNQACITTPAVNSNKIKITVAALPAKPAITKSRSTQLCLFDSVTLTTVAATTWQWQRNNKDIAGAVSNSYVGRIAGSYRVRVTNSTGCAKFSDTVAVTVVNADKPVITLLNDSLISSSATGNQWFYNLNTINAATGKTYKPNNMGYYSVQTTLSGCKSPMSDLFLYTANTLLAKGGEVSVLSASITPNPASSYAVLNVRSGNGAVQVTVTDIAGKRLWVSGKTTASQLRIPVGNLAQGTYIVLVENGIRGITTKLVVQR